MLTRRAFHIAVCWLGIAALSIDARGQSGDTATVRIRVDNSVRQSIPPILEEDLRIEQDQTEAAKELIRRAPAGRAAPLIFIIVGAMAIPIVLQMIRESLRQIYYGGVLIDMRSQPPSITNDPKIPGSMIFVIDTQGKETRYTSDQLSIDLFASLFKGR